MERCAISDEKSSMSDYQLEAALSSGETTRIRAKVKQAEVPDRATREIGDAASSLKQELFEFVMKHNEGWEADQVPAHLMPLLALGRIW